MNVNILQIIGSLLLVVSVSLCQKEDSLKVYQIPGVVVTATRSAISESDSPTSVEVYRQDDVKKSNGSSIADLLRHSTGIFINDLGGGASLKTAMVRGTSSQNLLLLVDGVRMNSMQNGLGYLNAEFLPDIDMVEIVYGGNSALYGADAVGGVINVITRKQVPEKSVSVTTSVGSHGFFSYFFDAGLRIGEIGLGTGFAAERARDDYKFRVQGAESADTESVRANADYLRRKWTLMITAVPHPKSILRIRGNFYKTQFGVPGGVDYPSPHARQSDDDGVIFMNYESDYLKNLEVTVGSAFRYNLEHYRDPDAYFPYDSYYKNLFLSVNPQLQLGLTRNSRAVAGLELSEGILASNDFDSRVRRTQRAVYISGEQELQYDRRYLDRFLLFQTFRYDVASDIDHAITPKIGLNIRLGRRGDLRLKASAGENFRVPTFNDLYFRGFGNPNLKPERSSSFDAGISAAAFFLGEHRGDLSYFYQRTTDRIIFDLSSYMTRNVGKSVSRGFEIRYGYSLFDAMLDVDFNYSMTEARKTNRDGLDDSTYGKKIPYLPENLINLIISVKINPLIITVFQNYTGKRFTNADNTVSLPAYMISSANVRSELYIFGLNLTLKGEVSNIFNKSYQTYQGYPMPGRTVRGTIGISY